MENNLIVGDSQIIELSKKEITAMAEASIVNIDYVDVIRLSAQVAKFQLLISEMEKQIKDKLFVDLRKFEGSKVTAYGIDFSEMEGGVKYEYSETESWVNLQNQIDALKEKQKDVEAFCKALKAPVKMLDEETGELMEFCPPSKSSTTTIKKVIK